MGSGQIFLLPFIDMPPIHPFLVHFPIALFTFAFVTEWLAFERNRDDLRVTAFASLIGALLGMMLAAASGWYDMSRAALGETHRYVDFHLALGVTLFAAVGAMTLWRWRAFHRPGRRVGRAYLALGLLVLALTLFQGWYGGVVFSQGAGVAAAGKGTEPSEEGRARLEAVTIEGIGAHGGGEDHASEASR